MHCTQLRRKRSRTCDRIVSAVTGQNEGRECISFIELPRLNGDQCSRNWGFGWRQAVAERSIGHDGLDKVVAADVVKELSGKRIDGPTSSLVIINREDKTLELDRIGWQDRAHGIVAQCSGFSLERFCCCYKLIIIHVSGGIRTVHVSKSMDEDEERVHLTA